MGGDHHQIRATHGSGQVGAAHDTDQNGATDNRLGQLSAALHRDFAFETILFEYAALVCGPNGSEFSAQTRTPTQSFSLNEYGFVEQNATQHESNPMSRFTGTSEKQLGHLATKNHRTKHINFGRLYQIVDLHCAVLGAAQRLSLPGRAIADRRNTDFVENVRSRHMLVSAEGGCGGSEPKT